MLRPHLKIWEWELIFDRAVKGISTLGVRSPWSMSIFEFDSFGVFDRKNKSIFCDLSIFLHGKDSNVTLEVFFGPIVSVLSYHCSTDNGLPQLISHPTVNVRVRVKN